MANEPMSERCAFDGCLVPTDALWHRDCHECFDQRLYGLPTHSPRPSCHPWTAPAPPPEADVDALVQARDWQSLEDMPPEPARAEGCPECGADAVVPTEVFGGAAGYVCKAATCGRLWTARDFRAAVKASQPPAAPQAEREPTFRREDNPCLACNHSAWAHDKDGCRVCRKTDCGLKAMPFIGVNCEPAAPQAGALPMSAILVPVALSERIRNFSGGVFKLTNAEYDELGGIEDDARTQEQTIATLREQIAALEAEREDAARKRDEWRGWYGMAGRYADKLQVEVMWMCYQITAKWKPPGCDAPHNELCEKHADMFGIKQTSKQGPWRLLSYNPAPEPPPLTAAEKGDANGL